MALWIGRFVSALRIVVKPGANVKRLRMFSIYTVTIQIFKNREIIQCLQSMSSRRKLAKTLGLILNWLQNDGFREGCYLDEISLFLRSSWPKTDEVIGRGLVSGVPDGLNFT